MLLQATRIEWVELVLDKFDCFLADHADCERKASASAMAMVVRFPERTALIEPMISLAKEELSHFHQVYRLMAQRNVQVKKNESDPYIKQLTRIIRHPEEQHFLDRLLVSGVIEARAHERLSLIAEHLSQPDLAKFYRTLAKEEAGHFAIFYRIACHFFPTSIVSERLSTICEFEDSIIQELPLRPAIH